MRNGDRVVATPTNREEVDLAALAEAVLLMLVARTGEPAGDSISVPRAAQPDSGDPSTNPPTPSESAA